MKPVISPAIAPTAVKSHKEFSAGTLMGVCTRSRSFAASFELPFFLSLLKAIHPMSSTKTDGLKGLSISSPAVPDEVVYYFYAATHLYQLTLLIPARDSALCCCHVFMAVDDLS